ncbi:MAG TPA: flagellar biosynthesis protein FlhF [Tepidisphaeraceae bacterium]|jgi:flagellar biosynthesis protein FlhF|nr:flagellar biosynthesis protein FlhF [Tepidisphaeraceae bacterium]
MNLQTFKAPTMGEALTQVKSVMGTDAVILHTRTFQTRQWWGLRRREMVEITAGKGINVGARHVRRPQPQTRTAVNTGVYGRNGAAAGNGAPAGNGSAPRNPIEGGKQLLETPGAQSVALLGLTQEMSALKGMVKDLVTQNRVKALPGVPEELFDYYVQLLSSEVEEQLACEIIKALHASIRPEHLQQPDFVRERLAEQLEKLLPTTGPIERVKKHGPHIVALIGPTGVGKTTTLAKLAANLKLREKHRVGLITLDTYRIAAVDQLKRYADIIGAPLRVVNGVDDLREAMKAMSDCDFLLIDTAGRSPNDTLKLNELKSLLETAGPEEVHLVLSATSSSECLQLAISRFSDVRVDKVIFTKIDEAAHVGSVLNVLRKVNKSLSYITTGQDVPDDIEIGKGRRLAQLILGGAL